MSRLFAVSVRDCWNVEGVEILQESDEVHHFCRLEIGHLQSPSVDFLGTGEVDCHGTLEAVLVVVLMSFRGIPRGMPRWDIPMGSPKGIQRTDLADIWVVVPPFCVGLSFHCCGVDVSNSCLSPTTPHVLGADLRMSSDGRLECLKKR